MEKLIFYFSWLPFSLFCLVVELNEIVTPPGKDNFVNLPFLYVHCIRTNSYSVVTNAYLLFIIVNYISILRITDGNIFLVSSSWNLFVHDKSFPLWLPQRKLVRWIDRLSASSHKENKCLSAGWFIVYYFFLISAILDLSYVCHIWKKSLANLKVIILHFINL